MKRTSAQASSITAVAAKAGVSIATVSRIVDGAPWPEVDGIDLASIRLEP